MSDKQFLTFPDSTAPGHISKCLNYFFDDGRNKYTFSDAYLKYSKFADEPHITAKRLFNIVRSTTLVSEQLLFRQQTTSGFLYFINNKFYKLAERHFRRVSRRQSSTKDKLKSPKITPKSNHSTTGSSNSSTIIEIPSTIPTDNANKPTSKNNSTIGSLSIGDTWEDTSLGKEKSSATTKPPSKTPSSPADNPISTSVTDITAIMDKDITDTMVEITTPMRPSQYLLNEQLLVAIKNEISAQLDKYLHGNLKIDEIRHAHEFVEKFDEDYKAGAEKIRARMSWVNANMESYEKKFLTKFEDAFQNVLEDAKVSIKNHQKTFSDQLDDMSSDIQTKRAVLEHDVAKLASIIENSHMTISNMDASILPSADTLKNITSQMKALLKQYQSKVTVLDSTIDVLTEELDATKAEVYDNLERQANELLTKMKKEIHFDQELPPTNPVTPQKTTTSRLFQNKWPTNIDDNHVQDHHRMNIPQRSSANSPSQHTTPYQGVRTDIIRKNVKLSCQDEQQLLDFYIKLRTAMIQAGIFLREINEITEDEDLFEERDGLTSADYRLQANALYGFLCNEDVIPQDFTFAQNCIKSFSSTMDGFQTLKRMLVLVHPLLNNRRPPNEPPYYSDSGDLHLYEQALRNFYLLHEIYGRSKYTDLDKSKQFLEGLDGDDYETERTRLTAILDAVELNNVTLQVKHRITSLASTIMNMKNKSSSKVQINAFSNQRNSSNCFSISCVSTKSTFLPLNSTSFPKSVKRSLL